MGKVYLMEVIEKETYNKTILTGFRSYWSAVQFMESLVDNKEYLFVNILEIEVYE